MSPLNPLQPDADPHQNCPHLVSADSSAAWGVHHWLPWSVSFLPSFFGFQGPNPSGFFSLLLATSSQSAFHPQIVSLGSISPLMLPCPQITAPLASTPTGHLEASLAPLSPPPAAVSGLSEGHPHPLLGDQSPSPPEVLLAPFSCSHAPLHDHQSPRPAEFSSFNSVQLVPSSVLLPLLWVKPLTPTLNHISQTVPKFQSPSHFQHPLFTAFPGRFL